MIHLQRIGDSSYLLESQEQKAILYVDAAAGSPHLAERVVRAASSVLFSEDGATLRPEQTFALGAYQWRFNKNISSNQDWATWALQKFTDMIHPAASSSLPRFKVEISWGYGSYLVPKNYGTITHPGLTELSLEEAIEAEAPENRGLLKAIHPQEWEAGVRAKSADLLSLLNPTQPRYHDPFTRLASLAFQRYESEFSCKDHADHQNCQTRLLITEENSLILKQLDRLDEREIQNQGQAVQVYRAWLESEYGTRKLAYLEHLIRVDLGALIEANQGLTPEHIYRFNMGGLILDAQELQEYVLAFVRLQAKGRRLDPGTPMATLLGIEQEGPILPLAVTRRLRSTLGERASARGFLHYLDLVGITQRTQKLGDLPSRGLALLVDTLTPSIAERQLSYTGRRIHEHIRAYYTTAEAGNYKPWVELQELQQAIDQLYDHESWDHFYEKLALVLCKRHLMREHPVENYRVGAIIPAPNAADGSTRWYCVTRAFTNNFGILSYKLEPLGQDPSLPVIAAYRSTASDSSNLHWASSMLSDLNPLNSPGYEGFRLAEESEREFFKQSTVPVWVAYVMWAEQLLHSIEGNPDPNEEVLNQAAYVLESAQGLYIESETVPHQSHDFHHVIRRYDYVLNTLAYECRLSKDPELASLIPRYQELYERHLRPLALDENCRLPEIQRQLAEELRDILGLFLTHSVLKSKHKHLHDLCDALDNHVLSDTVEDRFKLTIISATHRSERAIEGPVKKYLLHRHEGNLEGVRLALTEWTRNLMELARRTNEHPDTKRGRDHCLIGHSLGGAAAQVSWVRFFVHSQRVPLPRHMLEGRFIDAPKINAEDNQAYLRFGKRHEQMLRALGIRLRISHHHEYHDIIGLCGEGEHLGATHSAEEDSECLRFQEFDGRVLRRLTSAKDHQILESLFAHETQFYGPRAQKAVTFFLDNLDHAEGDYISTSFSSRIMGMVDCLGTDHEWKGSKNPAYDLVTKLWGVSWHIASTVEGWRSGNWLDSRRLYYAEERWKENRVGAFEDEQGVFLATLESASLHFDGLS